MWIVYILKCADSSLYTGITNNLEARIIAHTKGTGAKYTRGRGPFIIVLTERYRSKGNALRREAQIKSLSREQKLALLDEARQTDTIITGASGGAV